MFMETENQKSDNGKSGSELIRFSDLMIQGYTFVSVSSASEITYDLQRFAAEDEGRTKEATEKRKSREREKGNVVKSQDVTQAAVLLGTIITLFFMSTWMYTSTIRLFNVYLNLDFAQVQRYGMEDVRILLMNMFIETGKIVAPVMAAAVIMAVTGNILQVGLLFTTTPLEFNLERIIPDFKRILPVRRTLINLAKTIVQVIIVGFLAYLLIVDDFIPMLKASNMGLLQAVSLFSWVSFKLIIAAAILFIALAIPDYFYQRFEYMENLKMTVQEVKEEHKEEEGDPVMRQKQREIGMQLRKTRNMLKETETADVVITNPTHYAVALRYDMTKMAGPMVVAKGTDELAFTIRRIAKSHNVRIEENPPLARSLYASVEVGDKVPEEMYHIIARIFAKIDKFRKGA
jgi:flagellar biosynthesis protein FlhB